MINISPSLYSSLSLSLSHTHTHTQHLTASTISKPSFSKLLKPSDSRGETPKEKGMTACPEVGVALPVLTTDVSELHPLIQELSSHYNVDKVYCLFLETFINIVPSLGPTPPIEPYPPNTFR